MAPPNDPYSALGLLVSTLNESIESSGGVMLMKAFSGSVFMNAVDHIVIAGPWQPIDDSLSRRQRAGGRGFSAKSLHPACTVPGTIVTNCSNRRPFSGRACIWR